MTTDNDHINKIKESYRIKASDTLIERIRKSMNVYWAIEDYQKRSKNDS